MNCTPQSPADFKLKELFYLDKEVSQPKAIAHKSELRPFDFNDVFEKELTGKIPNEIKRIFQSTEIFTSGYIQEIEKFWLATASIFYILNVKNTVIEFKHPISEPIVTAFYHKQFECDSEEEYIVLSHKNKVSLILKEGENNTVRYKFMPVTYNIPSGVSITTGTTNYAGCNDGLVRTFSIENKNGTRAINVGGNSSLKYNDPITSILVTEQKIPNEHTEGEKTIAIIYTTSIKGEISKWTVNISKAKRGFLNKLFEKETNPNEIEISINQEKSTKASHVSHIVNNGRNIIAYQYNLKYCVDFTQNSIGINTEQTFGVISFDKVEWVNGFYAATTKGPANAYDFLYLIRTSGVAHNEQLLGKEPRLGPFVARTRDFGHIYNLVSIGTDLIVLCSKGFFKISEKKFDVKWELARRVVRFSRMHCTESNIEEFRNYLIDLINIEFYNKTATLLLRELDDRIKQLRSESGAGFIQQHDQERTFLDLSLRQTDEGSIASKEAISSSKEVRGDEPGKRSLAKAISRAFSIFLEETQNRSIHPSDIIQRMDSLPRMDSFRRMDSAQAFAVEDSQSSRMRDAAELLEAVKVGDKVGEIDASSALRVISEWELLLMKDRKEDTALKDALIYLNDELEEDEVKSEVKEEVRSKDVDPKDRMMEQLKRLRVSLMPSVKPRHQASPIFDDF